MCGRFGQEQTYVQLALRYRAVVKAIDPGPRYNIAPTDPVAVIVEYQGERYLAHHRWGLVPYWAEGLSVGNRMINARAETVATRPAFRDSFEKRRCVVPATRFYEWKRVDSKKAPYTILRSDGFPMSLAGLWASWRDSATHERVLTCTIVTTRSNAVVAQLHDRMPVVLDDESIDRWLDPDFTDERALLAMLRPCADDELYTYQVSALVNNVKNDGPELVAPV